MDQDPRERPVAIVGAGAVGVALARRLAQTGFNVAAIISRRTQPAEMLAEDVGASVATTRAADLPSEVRAVFAAVPDDAIAGVAAELVRVDHDWTQTVVAHTSGALASVVLAPLEEAGAPVLSFHPMQTFTSQTAPSAFDGIYVGLEGSAGAVAYGDAVARQMGATPFHLTPESKTSVHCAAALASNGLVALISVVREVLGTAGLDPSEATGVVEPLVEQTWSNLKSDDPQTVLTGPVARGDRGTVQAHVDALYDTAPHLLPVYAALATEQTRVAVQAGRLAPDPARAVLDVLHEALSERA